MEVIEGLRNFVDKDVILQALSEAEEVGSNIVIFSFIPSGNSDYLEGLNFILKVNPYLNQVIWVRVEFLISKDFSAKKFFTEVVNEVFMKGGEIAIKKDGISLIFKLRGKDLERQINNLIDFIAKLIPGKVPNFKYSSFAVIESG